MNRRKFLSAVGGIMLAQALPGDKNYCVREKDKDGPVDMSLLRRGPFISLVNVLNIAKEQCLTTVRVKFNNNVIDFNQCGLPKDLDNAEHFLRLAGFNNWIVSDDIKRLRRT